MTEVRNYPEWDEEAQNALISGIKMLDVEGNGVGRQQLRAIFPFMGWNDIQKGLDAVLASGKVKSRRVRLAGAKVGIEHFSVVEG